LIEKYKERKFTAEDLHRMQQAIYLAEKMGESLGRSEILQ
jgi:hypothetical protein